MTAEELVGLLAEPERLRVVAALVLGASGPAEIGKATGLDPKTVAKALRRLEDGGVVQDGRVREDLFKEAARAGAAARPADDHGYADQRIESVLRIFIRDGRITGFPAQPSRRRILLEHVAQSFEPGARYPEREVDAILRAWCEGGDADHVTLRRYLVDHGLLTREDNTYWRSGGWLDVLGDSGGV